MSVSAGSTWPTKCTPDHLSRMDQQKYVAERDISPVIDGFFQNWYLQQRRIKIKANCGNKCIAYLRFVIHTYTWLYFSLNCVNSIERQACFPMRVSHPSIPLSEIEPAGQIHRAINRLSVRPYILGRSTKNRVRNCQTIALAVGFTVFSNLGAKPEAKPTTL